jgi:excinuclease ABC subunit A
MSKDIIFVKGAREHNLKNVDVTIPRDKFVVITGLSGSGKSSLAFDTIYAEGQRRYVESLSAYARQFLGQVDKPDVDYIEGLSPAISIDQKTTSKNPRSTVGTVTEIYDYMRLLYARIGIPHCPKCGREISQQTVDQMVDKVMSLEQGTKIQVLSPVVRGRKGEFAKIFKFIRKSGFLRMRVDGSIFDVNQDVNLKKNKKHSIEIIVDRLVIRPGIEGRLADSLEIALKHSEGLAMVEIVDGDEWLFSENYACPDCGISIEELSPRVFSFNSPFGACPVCSGLGTDLKVDPNLLLPDKTKAITSGAINSWLYAKDTVAYHNMITNMRKMGIDVYVPIEDMEEDEYNKFLYGDGEYEGIIGEMEARFKKSKSGFVREEIFNFLRKTPCPACHGKKLKPESLAVTVGGINISDMTDMPVRDLIEFLKSLNLSERENLIASQILKEIKARLGFLIDVGLDYLTLSRASATLSGGESQRIRLASQIGSGLVGVLYILDEPSIGLHQRDNKRLLKTLLNLRDLGNTLIIVEHDEETMYTADYIVDVGPGPGSHGGEIVASGTIDDIKKCKRSITGQYLSGAKSIPVPTKRRKPNGHWLTVKGAKENNLKDIDVSFPMGVFTCVTGVSGSGKSSLVNEILYKALAKELNGAREEAGRHDSIEGTKYLDKVINIDQSPIGRTPRSNPATYTGVFNYIRDVFSQTPDAKMRGYKPGRFSFNVKGGRCEACRGDGIIRIEMHFLSDVYVPCEVCKGKRYNRETLEVKYKGKNIADILDMTVEEALDFFGNIPRIESKLSTLYDVGLGYIKLGQPSTQLSGGEAQRVKLATELSRRPTGKTLYILDEPTTGLHAADVQMLLNVLERLAEGGNTVIVIEHNMDVIKTADYIIDLGPEGGDRGGEVIAKGTPEEVSMIERSYTGQYLKPYLKDVVGVV